MSTASWVLAAVLAAALAVTLIAHARLRGRLARLREGVEELSRGNLGHRMMVPGRDAAASLGESLDHLAENMQHEREEAARREAARRRLFEDISHDLRTPITSIAGYVDALQRGLGDEPERYLAILSGKAAELGALTDDLFYAARIEAGELTLAPRRIDIAEVVRRTVLGFEPQLTALRAEVTLSIPDARCSCETDESALRRILGNIVGNSIRHAENMRSFSASVTGGPDGWRIRIANDGSGFRIPASDLFERGASAGGSGLGLAISRELARRLGATLLASEPAEGGVAFVLTLPSTGEAP